MVFILYKSPLKHQGFAGTSLLRWIWISYWLHLHHSARNGSGVDRHESFPGGVFHDVFCLHPQKLTWNLEMMVSNRNLLFQGSIFRFHVCFGGCTCFFWRITCHYGCFWGIPFFRGGWNDETVIFGRFQVVGHDSWIFFHTDIFIRRLNWWHCFILTILGKLNELRMEGNMCF